MVEILVPIGAFAMIFGIAYLFITSRNRERMALIEKGADPALFEAPRKGSIPWTLKAGMLFLGVGVGVFIANLLVTMGMDDDSAYGSMIFIFGGLGLIVAYLLQKKADKEAESKK